MEDPKPPDAGSEPPALEKPDSFVRSLAADAGFAFLGGILATLVIGSLSAAGVITMGLARALLVAAWLVGILLMFVAQPVWKTTPVHKVIFAVIFGALLLAVERYEAAHQPKPDHTPTAQEVAQAVLKNLPKPAIITPERATLTPPLSPGTNKQPLGVPPTPAQAKAPTPALQQEAPANDPDNTVAIRCNEAWAPDHKREDRPLYQVQIIDPPLFGTPFPGAANVWDSQGSGPINQKIDRAIQFYRCTMTNYGTRPLFGVSVKTNVSWQAVEKLPNGSRGQRTVAQQAFQFPALDLGTGEHNEDYFYIFSRSSYFVLITVENIATARGANDDTPREIKLIPPSNMVQPFVFGKQTNLYFAPYVPSPDAK
jgi:hypothetical protein